MTFIETRPRRTREGHVASEYTALSKLIKAEGLLERATGFYVRKFILWALVAGVAIFVSTQLGTSWWQILVAAVLGVATTQMAFMAHETAHRQVFASNKANDRVGLVMASLFAGLSYDWWMAKHTRHHANPNLVGKDPDIAIRGLVFTTEQAASKRGHWRFIAKNQGWLFFPLLTLTAFDLLASSLRLVFGREQIKNRRREILYLLTHYTVTIALPFIFFPPLLAGVFVLTSFITFGFYMGASFAPNHKGMPVLPKDAKVDFFTRQVMTSRNIRPNWFIDGLMGGLNYQIEHHLFPSMPRPHLKRAKEIVRQYCVEKGIHYTETGLFRSYGIVMRYLNEVGLGARDPFDCPLAASYGYSAG